MSRHGHNPSASLLPTTTQTASKRRIGVQTAEGESCPTDFKKKEKFSGPPVDNCAVPEMGNCCVIAKKTLLNKEEYGEWLALYLENCQRGMAGDPDRFWKLSRRLHLWRDGFTSDSEYQKMRAKYFDRMKIMSALACGLSEFIGTFIFTFLPVLIIAGVPLGAFEAYGAFGPVAFAVSALVAGAFTHLFMHGSYFEPTTTLLLYWFSDDFTVKKRRNFWPTFGRIVGQLAAAFVGAALLLILWGHGSEQFERVAQIPDYPNFWESDDTDDDFAGPGHSYNVGQCLFVTIICALCYNLATFAIHVISRSTIADFTSYNVLVPVLVGMAIFVTVWGQWNITRGSSGIVKWLATESVLVGHWAYGETEAMQASGWVIPVGILISHAVEILMILAFGWLFKYSGFIPKGYGKIRAGARAITKHFSSDSESSDSSDSD